MTILHLITDLSLEQPWWLGLLIFWIPIVMVGRRHMQSLGPGRQWLAIGLRCLVWLVLVLLLARLDRVQRHEDLALIAVLDRSQSIPRERQEEALDRLAQAVQNKPSQDRFALIDVAENASISSLPSLSTDLIRRNSSLQGYQTRLDAGIEMAMAMAPPDTPVRILLASEGNQTSGDLRRAAQVAATNGIPIDVLPLTYRHQHEVILKRLVCPARARPFETVSLRFVLESTGFATGKLRLFVNGRAVDLAPADANLARPVHLVAGINAVQVSLPVGDSGVYSYEAVFTPTLPDQDQITANNKATGMTLVSGPGRIVLVDTDGRSAQTLADHLRGGDMEIQVQEAASLPQDLARYLDVDALILVNVDSSALTFAQQDMLHRYVTDLGGGLIMVGGPKSFGAGGWIGSPVADVLPVDLDPPEKKQMPKGALVLVMDRSGSMTGLKVMMAKAAAMGAVRLLSRRDLTGTVLFDSQSQWLVPITEVGDKEAIIKALRTIGAGGGTVMGPAIKLALAGLKDVDVGVKHIILLSDGQTSDAPVCADLAQQLAESEITVSTVGIGSDINVDLMRYMAQVTHGRFYQVDDPARIPQIFVKEAQVVRRAMIVERTFVPQVEYGLSEILKGLGGSFPPLDGYVLTASKGGLNQVILQSDQADPILAAGQAGLGRSVAFTSSADGRWAASWLQWSGFDSFWQQVIRWTAKPAQPTDVEVSTELLGTDVTVEAEVQDTDPSSRVTGQILGPDLQAQSLALTPVGPGQYRGHFQAAVPGSYIVNVLHHTYSMAARPVSSVVSVPFAPEFQDLHDNQPLLAEVAALTGGRVLHDPPGQENLFDLKGVKMPQTHIPLTNPLLFAFLVLFLLDVAVRRVALDLPALWQDVRHWVRRRAEVQDDPTLTRLRQRRQRLKEQLSSQQAEQLRAARFQAKTEPTEPLPTSSPDPPRSRPRVEPQAEPPAGDTVPADQASHIQQLLRAKRQAHQKRND